MCGLGRHTVVIFTPGRSVLMSVASTVRGLRMLPAGSHRKPSAKSSNPLRVDVHRDEKNELCVHTSHLTGPLRRWIPRNTDQYRPIPTYINRYCRLMPTITDQYCQSIPTNTNPCCWLMQKVQVELIHLVPDTSEFIHLLPSQSTHNCGT